MNTVVTNLDPRLEASIDAMLAEVIPQGSAAAVAAELDAVETQTPLPLGESSEGTWARAPAAQRGWAGGGAAKVEEPASNHNATQSILGLQLAFVAICLLTYSFLGAPATLIISAGLLIVD